MIKKMFVKRGYSFLLVDLVIDENDLDLWMNLIDYYPLWKDMSKDIEVKSIEEYAEDKNFNVNKDSWEISNLLKRIVFEDNPLVISNAIKKLYVYVTKKNKKKLFLENIFNRFSYKIPNVELKNKDSMMNTVAHYNYLEGEKVFEDMVCEMVENEKECNSNLSKKKEKKLAINIKNSIPSKSILF